MKSTYYWPKPLRNGSTVGLVQISGAITDERYAQAIKKIEALGLKVYAPAGKARKLGYLGGSDEERIAELHHMFQNPEVDGIWCVRGGYGVQRILPMLDLELIRQNPKAIVGFSDITALLNYVTDQCQLVTFHGIMGVSAFSEFDKQMFTQVVMHQRFPTCTSPLVVHAETPLPAYQSYVIQKGRAYGRLIGGNLALMVSAIGTPYDYDYTGKIVLIEDIDEAPYRIDRMLTQLILAGKLQKAAGLVLGIFAQCDIDHQKPDHVHELSLRQVITDRLQGLGIPAVYGLPFGHIDHNATLPIGGEAMLDADALTLECIGANTHDEKVQ